MLLWALLASGQISMRKVDGSQIHHPEPSLHSKRKGDPDCLGLFQRRDQSTQNLGLEYCSPTTF